MELTEFTEKFVEAFEEYMERIADGNLRRLLEVRELYTEKAMGLYDNAIGNGEAVNEEYLKACIEWEEEALSYSEYDNNEFDETI